jgi:hypothetical protein
LGLVVAPAVVPVAPTSGAAPVSDAYMSALYNVANSGGSARGGGGQVAVQTPGDALRAAAAEAGNTDEGE